MVQEATHEFTAMRRARIQAELLRDNPDIPSDELEMRLDELQPEYEEYDPVVCLALAAVDHSNPPLLRIKCHTDVAQYLRPKLKAIEIKRDETQEAEKRQAISEMVEALGRLAQNKAGS
jgi:hypothetical protein